MFEKSSFFKSVADFLYPRYCYGCKRLLLKEEKLLCMHCCSQLMGTEIRKEDIEEVKEWLADYCALEHAMIGYYYTRPSLIQSLIYGLKFYGRMDYADFLGEKMAEKLLKTSWWQDTDVILPIPLHPLRKWKRGFNQSELIADVVARKLHLPVEKKAVKRRHYTRQQAKQTSLQRLKIDFQIFEVVNAEHLQGKHILLLDDLITTGTTMAECAIALKKVPGVRISLCAVAMPTP